MYLMLETMLLVKGLLCQIAQTNKSLLLSDDDWFATQELTECLKPVYDTTTELLLMSSLVSG